MPSVSGDPDVPRNRKPDEWKTLVGEGPTGEIEQDLIDLSTRDFEAKYHVDGRRFGSYVTAIEVYDIPHVSDELFEALVKRLGAGEQFSEPSGEPQSRPLSPPSSEALDEATDLVISALSNYEIELQTKKEGAAVEKSRGDLLKAIIQLSTVSGEERQ